jgi:GNAT superfamily N-acetyltransferase
MKILPVNNKKRQKEFLKVPKMLYMDDPVWVCPLDMDINNIFNPSKNTYFKHGTAQRWILHDDFGRPAGRIAAFIDYNTSKLQDQPTGGVGFFECINDQECAGMLFDTAVDWLRGKGMKAMDGPVNFGETDSYWGLLVDGFTHPSYEIAYNPPWYRELFESYGFRTYYKQEGFHLDLKKEFPSRFMKIAEWVAKKPEYSFRHFNWKEQEKLVNDFAEVFNEAWASFKENFEPLKPEYIHRTLKKARTIIDEEFIWFAYREDKPIAIYLMYPDVNQVLKHLNGKLHLFNKIKFLYLLKKKTINRTRGVLMGVIPKYQGLGIESAIIWNLVQVFKRKPHYREIEFSWVGDFNPKMRKIFMSVGSIPAKHYITYRYLFDRNAPYRRYPIPE